MYYVINFWLFFQTPLSSSDYLIYEQPQSEEKLPAYTVAPRPQGKLVSKTTVKLSTGLDMQANSMDMHMVKEQS